MRDLKSMKREFEHLANAIQRLKTAEQKMERLKSFETTFGPQMESIRRNLKSPSKADEVERDLGDLERIAQEYERANRLETVPAHRVVASLFPSELSGVYSAASFIGSGGFARVFRAKRLRDGQEVAVKVPITLDAPTGKSFVREIVCWQRLNHRNICRLYDINILPIPYLEMELCQGSLTDLPKPIQAERAASLVFQVAEGLEHAHKQGIIHRDLKPGNILMRGDIPVTTDWGLSTLIAASTASQGRTLTPLYASPEQISPQKFGKPDHRADIYQLGVVFYELATGELPFRGDNMTELMAQIIMAEPKKPSLLNPETSRIEPMILKCLQKEMNERYQSVAEIQNDLAPYLKGEYMINLDKSQDNIGACCCFCAELCLVDLMVEDWQETLKHVWDLSRYTSGDIKAELETLASELELSFQREAFVPEVLLDRAMGVLDRTKGSACQGGKTT